MIDAESIKKLIESGLDANQILIVVDLLESLTRNEKENSNVTKRNALRNALRQKRYRENKVKSTLPVTRYVTHGVTNESQENEGEIHSHIENAGAPDSLLLNLKVSKKESKKERKQDTGKRLEIVTLPTEWKTFCEQQNSSVNALKLFEEFRDYWIGIPGQRGRKLDWFATWRNRVREKSVGKNAPQKPQQTKPTAKTINMGGKQHELI